MPVLTEGATILEGQWRRGDVVLAVVETVMVCFCRASGETHLLDAFPAAVLEQVPAECGVPLREVAAALGEAMGEDAGAVSERVEAVLTELSLLGLVNRCGG